MTWHPIECLAGARQGVDDHEVPAPVATGPAPDVPGGGKTSQRSKRNGIVTSPS